MKTARRWTEEQARLLVEEHAAEVLRTSEALRQSRDELQLIYDGMVEGLVIVDAQTKRIVGVNSLLCRMSGYAKEELLSLSIMDIHPTDDRAGCAERIQSRADGRVEEDRNVPMLRKDGRVFFADILGNTLTYGGRPCVLGLYRDITERKQRKWPWNGNGRPSGTCCNPATTNGN